MDFQNHRAPGTNGTPVIIECCFVGGADLAQGSSCGFDYFTNSKTATDLDHFTARNYDFILRGSLLAAASKPWSGPAIARCKMVDNENQSCRAIIDRRSGFCFAK